MNKCTDSRRNSLRNLWCSAAFVGVVFASQAAQARGIFEDHNAKPTIEVNLGVIQQLKAERAAAPAPVPEASPEKSMNVAEEVEDTPSALVRNDAPLNAHAPLEVLPESLPETQETSESLPIVVKEVEAPVAPMYQENQLVKAPEETEPKEKRTLVSVFEDWFGGKPDTENVVQDDTSFVEDEELSEDTAESEEEAIDASQDIAMDEDEVEDVLQIESLPAKETKPESIVVYSRPQSAPTDDVYMVDDEDEEIVNTGETKVNRVAAGDGKTSGDDADGSFFNRLFKALKPSDVDEKKQSIVVSKPDVDVLEDKNSVSIFGDSAETTPNGRELLQDAEPEEDIFAASGRAVEEKPSPSRLDENKYTAVEPAEDIQIILPNEVEGDDLIMRTPTPSTKPKMAVQEKEKEVARVVQPASKPDQEILQESEVTLVPQQPVRTAPVIKNIFEKVEESEEPSLEVTKTDEKRPFLTPVEEEEVQVVESEEEAGHDIAFIDMEQPEEEELVVVKPTKLDDGPIDIMAPAIPDTTEVVEEIQEEKLQATPVIVEEDKPSFAERLKGWLPFGNKEEDVAPENVRETALTEVEDDMPPPSLPEVVEVSDAVDDVAASSAPQTKAIPEVFEVRDEPELPEGVQIILPNEIKDEASVEVASLDSDVVEKHNQVTAKESNESILSLNFIPAQTEIMAEEKARITSFAEKFAQDRSKRLKIVSYASQVENNTGSARRISLQRAIAIRSVMIDNGVSGVRINVQAMGDKVDGGIVDRADIEVIGN